MPVSKTKQVIIAVNPTAGARDSNAAIDELSKALTAEGFHVTIETDLEQLALQAESAQREESLKAVVAAGGDGTIAAVVNCTKPGVPIIPFPQGTENLLARYLGIPASAAALCGILQNGRTVTLDAGQANGRLFLLMASCGLDAEIVRRVQQARRGHINHLSYLQPILQSVQSYSYPPIRVLKLDEQGKVEGEISKGKWAFVINVPMYAGGLQIAPDAVGDDGRLDVCTFREGSLMYLLYYLSGVLTRQHPGWSDCHVSQQRRLRIESDEPVPYQLDGDFGGNLPMEIEVLPARVTLLVPADGRFAAAGCDT